MGRFIRFLGILPLLLLSGPSSPRFEVPEAEQIPNWPAPSFWTTPAARAPGQARTEAVSTISAPLLFVALPPCRILDTRGNGAPIQGGIFTGASDVRNYTISPICGVPAGVAAVSLNFTVVGPLASGFLVAWPTGEAVPPTSILNFTAGQTVANAAVVPTSTSGSITVNVSASTHLIVDINGYYDGTGAALQSGLSRRAVLDQFWTPQNALSLGLTTVGTFPLLVKSDGTDVWVANAFSNSVSRVRASDGKLLETWTGATQAAGVLVAMGKVFVSGNTLPGRLYRIDPSQPAGPVTTVASNLGGLSLGLTFDGSRIWTANAGSVCIVTPGATLPWSVTTVTAGFSGLVGALYDGTNVWVTDNTGVLLKLDENGAILQTVTVGSVPQIPIFDGTNIWVPNSSSSSVSVVRASTGAVLATLTGNGLSGPTAAAFNGQRVLVTNYAGNSVSLWKTADLTQLGSFPTGTSTSPSGACSDGINFWITLSATNQVARF